MMKVIFYNYLTNKNGPFKVICIIMAVCSVVITVMYIILVQFVLAKNGGLKAFGHIRNVALIVEIISNGLRFIIYFIDPFGIYGNIPYIISRICFMLQGPFNVFCSIILILVWLDSLASINASMKMKKRTSSVIATNKDVRYSLLTAFGFLIVLDAFADLYDYLGYDNSGNVFLYQGLSVMCAELLVTIISLTAVFYRYGNSILDSSTLLTTSNNINKTDLEVVAVPLEGILSPGSKSNKIISVLKLKLNLCANMALVD